MKRYLSLFTLAALALLLMAPLAFAANIGEPDAGNGRWATPENGRMAHNGDIVYRCATDDKGRQMPAPDQAEIDRWIQENRIAAGGVIPVNFHVITNGATGAVSDATIAAQITVLNRNYAGRDYNGNLVSGARNTGYTFVLASVTRTSNRKWFMMTPGSRNEQQAKAALVVNPTGSLNLYTAAPGQNLLGWATFPWNLAGNPSMDGVVIHYGSLPGGYLSPYNLGGTASHEVGHWVGLYHTFQGGCGSDCATTGDLVCDTPAEGTATSGCPNGKDTCPAAGLDPIHNYMDYSTDICYNQFTTGQDARADFMMSTYRPSIGSAAKTLANAAGSLRELGGGLVVFKAKPNPFNPRTKIEFGMAREGRATVRVFDIQGRLVSTVVDKVLAAGNHSYDFDGARLASGIYFMSLKADGKQETRRLSLLK
jgi:hypothetical protein